MTYRNADLVKPFDHVAGGKKSPDGVRFQLPGGNAALFAEGNAQRLGKLAAGRAAKGRINHVKRERLFAISKKYLHPVFTRRSEEHTSELQSLMRISYAVFCLKKKKQHKKLS